MDWFQETQGGKRAGKRGSVLGGLKRGSVVGEAGGAGGRRASVLGGGKRGSVIDLMSRAAPKASEETKVRRRTLDRVPRRELRLGMAGTLSLSSSARSWRGAPRSAHTRLLSR